MLDGGLTPLVVSHGLAAMNILIVVTFGALAVLSWKTFRHERKVSTEFPYHSLGLCLLAGGMSLQRFYWAINRTLESIGYQYVRTAFYEQYSWVTLFPMAVAIMGVGLLMRGFLLEYYGKRWLAKYAAFVVLVWTVLVIYL